MIFLVVPMYDGRYRPMDLDSDKPYDTLPSLEEELLQDDVVWLGFNINKYYSDRRGADFVSFNVCWAVLLHRTDTN